MTIDEYQAERPARRSFRSLPSQVPFALRRFGYLLAHTLRPYESRGRPPRGLSMKSPSGEFSADHLAMCVRLARQSDDRMGKLEEKATTLLSLIAVLAPLSASAAVFVALHSPRWLLIVECAVVVLQFLASVAILRALAIREYEEIRAGGVIEQGAVRPYSADLEARGILYVAAIRDALADHIADFVRAAQVFLWIAIAGQIIAGGLALPLVRERSQVIEGTVNLAPATTEALAGLAREHWLAQRVDSLSAELANTQRVLDQLKPGPDRTKKRPARRHR